MQGADAPKRDLHDTLWSLISSTSQMEKNAANPKTRGQTVQLMQVRGRALLQVRSHQTAAHQAEW